MADLLNVLSNRTQRRIWAVGSAAVVCTIGGLLGRVANASTPTSGERVRTAVVPTVTGPEIQPVGKTTLLTRQTDATTTSPKRIISESRPFRLAVVGEISSDPLAGSATSVSESAITDLLWDGLTSYDEVRESVAPALAVKWYASDNYSTWRFDLDPTATFGSGRPIRSNDVKFSLLRAVASTSDSLYSNELREALKPSASDPTVVASDAVETSGEHSVVVHLRRPIVEFPLLLTNVHYGIVSEAHPEPLASAGHRAPGTTFEGSNSDGVGFEFDTSGRYRIDKLSDDGAVLKAARPNLRFSTIEAKYFGSVLDAYSALERKSVDWAPVPGARETAAISTYGSAGTSSSRLVIGLSLNSESAALKRPETRKAILTAIDSAAVTSKGFGARATVALSMVPKEFSAVTESDPCLDGCAFNPRVAKAQLAPLARANTSLNLDVFDTPDGRSAGAEIKKQLENVGLRINVRVTPVENYGATLSGNDTQLMLTGAVSLFPSASDFLIDGFSSVGSSNVTRLHSEALDEKLATTQTEPVAERRADRYGEAERMIRSEAVFLPIAQIRTLSAFAVGMDGAWLGQDGALHFGDGY